MQSFSLYIFSAIKRDCMYSIEAGLKYFIIGALSSSFLVMSFYLFYFYTGCFSFLDIYYYTGFHLDSESTVNFIDVFDIEFTNDLKKLSFDFNFFESKLYFSYLLVYFFLACFLFKLGSVPFHSWMHDVYEGAPTTISFLLSILSKIPVIYVFQQILCNFFKVLSFVWADIIFFSSICSIIVGNFLSFKQFRLKRLLITSSIVQTGYIVLALSIQSLYSYITVYFFVLVYSISAIMLWGMLCLLMKKKTKVSTLSIVNTSGMFELNNVLSLFFLMSLLSVAGIPFFPGFFSKV